MLVRNTQNHLSRLRKDKPGLAVLFENELGEIVGKLGSAFPRSLGMEAQGAFRDRLLPRKRGSLPKSERAN